MKQRRRLMTMEQERTYCLATLWSEHRATGIRSYITVSGRDQRELDLRIREELGNVQANNRRPVKTEMTVDGVEWIYEYDSTGQVERTFRNGEVTP